MGTSTYSFGEDSPLKIQISDKLVTNYNAAVEEWFKAQTRFNQRFGKKWDPVKNPIRLKWSKPQRKAWNEVASILSKVVDQRGPFHENDFMDDFLIKNVAPAASAALSSSHRWSRAISMAAVAGAVYVVLSGRKDDA